jgi:quercetin dioxygenase-like cupin family protein
MRRVVTGLGSDGRSGVRSDGDAPVAFVGGRSGEPMQRVSGGSPEARPGPGQATVHELWALSAEPSVLTDDPTLAIDQPSFDVPAGATKWIITEMGPGLEAPMHATPTVDYGLVVRGAVELGLETGSVHLVAGDSVVVNGVLHSWRAGPEGCLIATVQVGLRPRERR